MNDTASKTFFKDSSNFYPFFPPLYAKRSTLDAFFICRLDQVFKERENGHRPDSAGHR
jgi:hypothetical protein